MRVKWTIVDAIIVFFSAWIVLPVVVVLLLRVTAPYMPMAQLFLTGLKQNQIEASFALTVINAVGALALLWWLVRRRQATLADLGWRSFDVLKMVGYLLAAFVVFVAATNAALWLVQVLDPSFNPSQAQDNDFISAAQSHRSLALVALVIIPPIIEETVFRGFIFPAFSRRWGLWVGALSSSILFGLAHLQANVSIYTFLLGLLLCFMYVRLRSIFPGMILHMINNYLAFVALTSPRL